MALWVSSIAHGRHMVRCGSNLLTQYHLVRSQPEVVCVTCVTAYTAKCTRVTSSPHLALRQAITSCFVGPSNAVDCSRMHSVSQAQHQARSWDPVTNSNLRGPVHTHLCVLFVHSQLLCVKLCVLAIAVVLLRCWLALLQRPGLKHVDDLVTRLWFMFTNLSASRASVTIKKEHIRTARVLSLELSN